MKKRYTQEDIDISHSAAVLFGIILGLCIGILITGIVCSIAFYDNLDMDDIIGPYMCKEHDLKFVRVETNLVGGSGNSLQGNDYIRIYCKEEENESLDDGYLIKIN